MKKYSKNSKKNKKLHLKLVISIDLFPGPVISRKSGEKSVAQLYDLHTFLNSLLHGPQFRLLCRTSDISRCLSFFYLSFARAGARLQIEFGASCNLTRDQYAYIHIDQELSHQFSSRKMNTTSWVFSHSDGRGWDGKEVGF